MLWNTIVDSYTRNPRNVQTVPIEKKGGTKKTGVWFYVSSQNGKVFVSKAQNHDNSSRMQGTRQLNKMKCDAMFALYQCRKAGEKVSQEAGATTYNQVYWYGIFHDLGL